jgi:hypothetical protein
MNFYQNLIGARVESHRSIGTIVAAWQYNLSVRVMYVCKDGESFLLDLPNPSWKLFLIRTTTL